MASKTNTIDYRDGGLEVFKRVEIYLSEGTITSEQLAHEKAAWQAQQYESITPQQLDLNTARQATAQLRELSKIQETILANDQKLIESHEKLSKIYHPQSELV